MRVSLLSDQIDIQISIHVISISHLKIQVENQTNLTFNPLQLHHAGEYTCVVTLSGFPNLNGNLSQSVSHDISIQGKLH